MPPSAMARCVVVLFPRFAPWTTNGVAVADLGRIKQKAVLWKDRMASGIETSAFGKAEGCHW